MEGRSDIKILYAFYIHICYSQMHRASTNKKNNCCATEPQKNYWRLFQLTSIHFYAENNQTSIALSETFARGSSIFGRMRIVSVL